MKARLLAVGCWLLSAEAVAQHLGEPDGPVDFVSGGPVECCFDDGCTTLGDADCMREQERRHREKLARQVVDLPQPREPADLEFQDIDLAKHPGSHLVLVEQCLPLADTPYRVTDRRDQTAMVCRVATNLCGEPVRADVIWRMPKFVGSPGKAWMRAPIVNEMFRVSLRPRFSEDGLPMIGYAQQAQEGVQCE